jgi:hypothetical protein
MTPESELIAAGVIFAQKNVSPAVDRAAASAAGIVCI